MSDATDVARTGIAIVGMACRLPGARNVDEFWSNVCAGVESIRRLGADEMLDAGLDPEELEAPHHVPVGALVDDIDRFDASFFGVTNREAEIMDPQQRVFLECAWEAIENAGYDPLACGDAVGVFAGANFDSYLAHNLLPAGVLDDASGILPAILANEKDYLATRVSYKLNLRGPAFTVQSGCSTSLVAVHLAVQSLLGYECDLALAGGVAIDVTRAQGYHAPVGSVASPSGHIRAFDADADGTVFGNGVGVVVLKRMEDALRDGDTVSAVILGSAVNNDGSKKVGFTAPSVRGQSRVIAEALAAAGIPAESVGYVETHGTGTPLGDPIEVEALAKAFRARSGGAPCAIGSVKSNVGHLDAAAGVTGLIKAALALRHRTIPPSLHYERPNPKARLDRTSLYVNTTLRAWETGPRADSPRRAGVSSFGLGGTNAHVVLQEPPVSDGTAAPASASWQLLVWSAKTPTALNTATENLRASLQAGDDDLEHVAFTLQAGRTAFEHRRLLVCRTRDEAVFALARPDDSPVRTDRYDGVTRRLAFLFPGQGAQCVGMGRALYDDEPTFRRDVDACREQLLDEARVDLCEVLFGSAGADDAEGRAARLDRTDVTQPSLFAIEYALARLWMRWGIEPRACVGHSLGEYVAACLAGVLSRADAMRVVIRRGQLMGQLREGAMTAVMASADELELEPGVEIAAVNGPSLAVVSGLPEAVDAFEHRMRERGVRYRRLPTTCAFHSSMVDPIIEPFVEVFDGVSLSPPTLPFVSNVTGRWITDDEATSPRYWAEHLRRPVRFAEGLRCLQDGELHDLLEVGPGHTLAAFARQQHDGSTRIMTSLPADAMLGPDLATWPRMLETLGRLWQGGRRIDWATVHGGRPLRRVALPTYPFERARYWIDPPADEEDGKGSESAAAARRSPDVGDWGYVPVWRQSPPVELVPGDRRPVSDGSWLVFSDESALANAVVGRLRSLAGTDRVSVVTMGDAFERLDRGRYVARPGRAEDYSALLTDLVSGGDRPTRFVHFWDAPDALGAAVDPASLADANDRGFYSLLSLIQALPRTTTEHAPNTPHASVLVVTRGACQVMRGEPIRPSMSTVMGPSLVVPQERPDISCACLDVGTTGPRPASDLEEIADRIVAELDLARPDALAAYRLGERWVPMFEPARLEPHSGEPLRREGVYVVLGGLGNIGLSLAEHLAKRVAARLVLVGRSPLPPREAWDDLVADPNRQDRMTRRVRAIRAIEALGGVVRTVTADVTSRDQMRRVVQDAEQHFGALHGVIMAAGVVDADAFKSVTALTRAECERQLRPKQEGLLALEDALGDRALDFCVITSSLSSMLGGVGYAAYAAANIFMDAFVRLHNAHHPTRWLGVNWDAWRWGPVPDGTAGSPLAQLAMTPPEAADVFERLLGARSADQFVVSTSSLPARRAQWVQRPRLERRPRVEPARLKPDDRPARAPADDERAASAPGLSPTQRVVSEVWQQILGIETVEMDESFLDLGGNSLTAVQAIEKLEERLGVKLAVEEFIFQTAGQLATLCEQKRASGAETPRPQTPRPETPDTRRRLLDPLRRVLTGR